MSKSESRQAAWEYYLNLDSHYFKEKQHNNIHTDAFEAGVEWEHKRLVDKACAWLKQNMYVEHIFEHNEDDKPVQYVCASACDSADEFVNNFCKAMEE